MVGNLAQSSYNGLHCAIELFILESDDTMPLFEPFFLATPLEREVAA